MIYMMYDITVLYVIILLVVRCQNNSASEEETELLDELAADFAAHDFDLKYLIRGIVASQTYQRTSRKTHDSQNEPQQFARMAVLFGR